MLLKAMPKITAMLILQNLINYKDDKNAEEMTKIQKCTGAFSPSTKENIMKTRQTELR